MQIHVDVQNLKLDFRAGNASAELLEKALESAEASGRLAFHSLLVVYLGEVLVLGGRFEDANTVAERAITLTRERGERGRGTTLTLVTGR